jgi:hypothetical protein
MAVALSGPKALGKSKVRNVLRRSRFNTLSRYRVYVMEGRSGKALMANTSQRLADTPDVASSIQSSSHNRPLPPRSRKIATVK